MKMKKLAALLLAGAMGMSLVACGGGSSSGSGDSGDSGDAKFEKMTWSASTAGADGSNFAAGLDKFAELISEKTDGAVTVEVYTSDQLTNGNQVDSVQGCMDGTIDVAFEADGVWGNFDTAFSIPNLPFLFSSYEDVDSKLINGEGGQYLSSLLADKYSVKCLGIGENGFRYITNSKRPIEKMSDLKGLKFRVGGSPILTATYGAWGVDYTVANWSEVYTGLQTGLYDGQENPVAVVDASSIQEVQKYVTSWSALYSAMFMTMNGDLYDSLSDDLKAIVDECGKEACAYQVELTRQQCEECLDKWVSDYGMELTEMTQENADEFKAASASVYDQYSDYNDLISLLGD